MPTRSKAYRKSTWSRFGEVKEVKDFFMNYHKRLQPCVTVTLLIYCFPGLCLLLYVYATGFQYPIMQNYVSLCFHLEEEKLTNLARSVSVVLNAEKHTPGSLQSSIKHPCVGMLYKIAVKFFKDIKVRSLNGDVLRSPCFRKFRKVHKC